MTKFVDFKTFLSLWNRVQGAGHAGPAFPHGRVAGGRVAHGRQAPAAAGVPPRQVELAGQFAACAVIIGSRIAYPCAGGGSGSGGQDGPAGAPDHRAASADALAAPGEGGPVGVRPVHGAADAGAARSVDAGARGERQRHRQPRRRGDLRRRRRVPNTCDTPEKRLILREQLAEIDFVVAPGAAPLHPARRIHGIRSTPTSRAGDRGGRCISRRFRASDDPVADERGRSAWPERSADEDITRMRRESGPHKFASQMMLTPVNIAEGRLDPALLVFYGDEIQSDELRGLYLRQTAGVLQCVVGSGVRKRRRFKCAGGCFLRTETAGSGCRTSHTVAPYTPPGRRRRGIVPVPNAVAKATKEFSFHR